MGKPKLPGEGVVLVEPPPPYFPLQEQTEQPATPSPEGVVLEMEDNKACATDKNANNASSTSAGTDTDLLHDKALRLRFAR